MQGDFSTRSSLVMSATVYSPSPADSQKHRFLVFRLPREYARSLCRPRKRRVETNTKLTDQLAVFRLAEPRDSRNDLVPDLAIVPRWLSLRRGSSPRRYRRWSACACFIERDTNAQFAITFVQIRVKSARKRSLSAASEALEISSRGRFLYWNRENGSSGAEAASL